VEHRSEKRRETFIEYLAAYAELQEKVLAAAERPRTSTRPLADL
jgi:hypothetical protein